MSLYILITAIIVLIIIGGPIYASILSSSIIYILIDTSIYPEVVTQQLYSGIDKYSLLAIPLYLFAGNLMSESGIGQRIISFMQLIFGRLPGGASISTILSSIFFSLVSGSAPATVLTVGKISSNAMIQSGYSKNFTLGLIISTGSLGIVIPPSIFLIVYGVVTGSSIDDLFAYGALAGCIFASFFLVYSILHSYFYKIKNNDNTQPSSFKYQLSSIPALILPFIVIIGISSGLTSPTEAGVTIVIYGIFLSTCIYKDLYFKDIFFIAIKSALTCSQIMIIMASASLLGWLISESNILDSVYVLFGQFEGYVVPLIILNIIFLLLGMLIDVTSLAVILSGIIIAVSESIQIPLTAIGVIMAITGAIGMYTPPFGLSLFVAKDIGGDYNNVIRALKPFYVISLIALIAINIVIITII